MRSTCSIQGIGNVYARTLLLWAVAVLYAGALGCEAEPPEADPHEVEVTAMDHAFQAPNEIPAGWVTFRMSNELAAEIHEMSIARLPDGVGFADFMEYYVPVWQQAVDDQQRGMISADEVVDQAMGEMPDWGAEVAYVNARGLVSPGRLARKTVHLPPGDYVMDCWVKTEDGQLHVAQGMARPFTVTAEQQDPVAEEEEAASSGGQGYSEASQAGDEEELLLPRADEQMHIASDGIEDPARLQTGWQRIEVSFEEGPDQGVPHHDNVHLIRLDDDTELAEVTEWLDWYRVDGLASPSPAEFLGGVSTYGQMPDHGAAYFSVEVLEPGEFAWVVKAPGEQQMWERFEVVE